MLKHTQPLLAAFEEGSAQVDRGTNSSLKPGFTLEKKGHWASDRRLLPYSISSLTTLRPSTVREQLSHSVTVCFSGSSNPSYQASLISWHNISIAMWQLQATLASSQSSRRREIFFAAPVLPRNMHNKAFIVCVRTT